MMITNRNGYKSLEITLNQKEYQYWMALVTRYKMVPSAVIGKLLEEKFSELAKEEGWIDANNQS